MIVGRVARLTLVVATAVVLTACDNSDSVDAGPLTSDTREVGSFDSIDVEGATRVQIAIGERESLVLEGEEAVLSTVKTTVRGDTLYIDTKRRRWFIHHGRNRLQIRITVPRLAALTLQGGNDVRIVGFNGGATTINATGAAQIKAAGQLEQLNVHMAGAGRADLSKLLADRAKVTVDGVASVIVNPKDALDATMNGVGAILYTGSPSKVKTRMNGLGTIGQRESDEGEWDDESQDKEHTEVDPNTLQPEYAEPAKKKQVQDSTEVI
jgi:hypothetical protein